MRHNTRGMLSWTVTALLTVALSTGVVALTTGNTVVSSATSATTTAASTATTPTTVAATTPTTQAQSTTVHYTTTYHGDDNYAVLPSGTTVKSTRSYTDN